MWDFGQSDFHSKKYFEFFNLYTRESIEVINIKKKKKIGHVVYLKKNSVL